MSELDGVSVRYISNASQVIHGEELRACRNLLTILEPSSQNGRTARVSFLTDFILTPNQSAIGLHHPLFSFDHPDAVAQAVIRKLAPVRPDIHRHELIPRIPLEGAGAVGGEVPIRVERKQLRRTGGVDLVLLRAEIARQVRRRDRERRRARTDLRVAFEQVARRHQRRLPVDRGRARLVQLPSDLQQPARRVRHQPVEGIVGPRRDLIVDLLRQAVACRIVPVVVPLQDRPRRVGGFLDRRRQLVGSVVPVLPDNSG